MVRSRVKLAKILKTGGNAHVLDEPTNCIDLSTLRLLDEALVGAADCCATSTERQHDC